MIAHGITVMLQDAGAAAGTMPTDAGSDASGKAVHVSNMFCAHVGQ